MGQSDCLLLDRWIQGRDTEAFSTLAERYGGMVYETCRRILNDRTEAEDVAQECFEALAQARNPIGGYVGPWLCRVARNRSCNRLRAERRRREREVAFVAGLETRREETWDDIYRLVDEAISEIPDKSRVPLVSHFFERKSHNEVAAILNVPRSTVSYRIQGGIKTLRQTLSQKGVLSD